MTAKLVLETVFRDADTQKFVDGLLGKLQELGPASAKAFEYMNKGMQDMPKSMEAAAKNMQKMLMVIPDQFKESFIKATEYITNDQIKKFENVKHLYERGLQASVKTQARAMEKLSGFEAIDPQSDDAIRARQQAVSASNQVNMYGAAITDLNTTIKSLDSTLRTNPPGTQPGTTGPAAPPTDPTTGGSGGMNNTSIARLIAGGPVSILSAAFRASPWAGAALGAYTLMNQGNESTYQREMVSPARAALMKRERTLGIYEQAASGNISGLLAREAYSSDYQQNQRTPGYGSAGIEATGKKYWMDQASNFVNKFTETLTFGLFGGGVLGTARSQKEISERYSANLIENKKQEWNITNTVSQMQMKYMQEARELEVNVGRTNAYKMLQTGSMANIPRAMMAANAQEMLRYGLQPGQSDLDFSISRQNYGIGNNLFTQGARIAAGTGGNTAAVDELIKTAIRASGLSGAGTRDARELMSEYLAKDLGQKTFTDIDQAYGASSATLRAFEMANQGNAIPDQIPFAAGRTKISPIEATEAAGKASQKAQEMNRRPGNIRSMKDTMLLMKFGITNPIEQAYFTEQGLENESVVKAMFANKEGRADRSDEFIKQRNVDISATTEQMMGFMYGKDAGKFKQQKGMTASAIGMDMKTSQAINELGIDVFDLGKTSSAVDLKNLGKKYSGDITGAATRDKDDKEFKWTSQMDQFVAGFTHGERSLRGFITAVDDAVGKINGMSGTIEAIIKSGQYQEGEIKGNIAGLKATMATQQSKTSNEQSVNNTSEWISRLTDLNSVLGPKK